MPVSFLCMCGNQVKTSRKNVGRGGRCPYCQRSVVIPGGVPSRQTGLTECLAPLGPNSSDDEINSHLSHYPLYPGDVAWIKQAIKARALQLSERS